MLKNRNFNGGRLKSARIYRGKTISQLADETGVSKQAISQFENNKTIPGFETLMKLTYSLEFPKDYFYEKDNVSITVGNTYFRAQASITKKEEASYAEKLSIFAKLYNFIEDYINFPKLNILQLDHSNDIDDIEFIHGRAEDFGKNEDYREKYDIATARAVAGLPVLMEFCVPFIKVGGYFVCLKGPNANLELEESKKAMEVLGVEYIEKIDVKLPESDLNHNILIFKKVKNTPSKYPRKAGKVSKNPIK